MSAPANEVTGTEEPHSAALPQPRPTLDLSDTAAVAHAIVDGISEDVKLRMVAQTPTFQDWMQIKKRLQQEYGKKISISRLKGSYSAILNRIEELAASDSDVVVITSLTQKLKSAVRQLLLSDPTLTPGALPALLLEHCHIKCKWKLAGKAYHVVRYGESTDGGGGGYHKGTVGGSSQSPTELPQGEELVGCRIRLKVVSSSAGKAVWRVGTVTQFKPTVEGAGSGTYTVDVDDASIGTIEGVDTMEARASIIDESADSPRRLGARVLPLSDDELRQAKSASIHDDTLWDSVSAIVPSTDGMNGVVFVMTRDGVVVLKASANATNEVFGSHLAEIAGLPSAKLRVIPRTDPIYHTIYFAVRTVTTTEHIGKVHRLFQFQHLLVFEFVRQSRQLDDPSLDPVATLDASSGDGRKRLRQLGELAALDTLLHNVDRIPVVCNNNGNAGNVLFSMGGNSSDSDVVAIDQCLNPIDPDMHPSHLQLYVQDCIDVMQSAVWFTNNKKGRLVGRRRCMCTQFSAASSAGSPSSSSAHKPSQHMLNLAEQLRARYDIDKTTAAAAVNKRPHFSKAMLFFHYPKLRNYLQTCMQEEFKAGCQPLGIIVRFRDFVALSTRFDVGHDGCVEFCRGIVVGATKMAALSEAKLQSIQQNVAKVMELSTSTSKDVSKQEHATRQYLHAIISAFRIGLSDVARGEGTEKLSVTERKDEELLDAPTLSRQPTSEGNAAVAAVEEATGHSHTKGVKSESHGARAAAEEGDSGHGLADLLAQETSMERAVLNSVFEILRWGEVGLPEGTFETLLRDRRLDPAGVDKHRRSLFMVAAKQNKFDKLRQLLTTFGARPFLAMVDSAGNNALHFACMYGCAESVAVVLEFAVLSDARRGEDCNELQSQLFLPNAHGYAPEVLALKQGFEAVFRSVFRAHHGFEADSEVLKYFESQKQGQSG